MTVATLAKEIPLPIEQALPIYIVGIGLLYACFVVYRRLLGGVRLRGGQVRSDLFGFPDTIVVGLFIVLMTGALAMQWLFPSDYSTLMQKHNGRWTGNVPLSVAK